MTDKVTTKVLLVEDLAALRQHLTHFLKDKFPQALEIIEASNGTEGLRLAKTMQPDLILMDISMPDISGIKVAQQIWEELPHMKILFWSQYHREAYVRELGKIVPDEAIHGYVLKSEGDDKLLEAILSVLLLDNPYIDPIVQGVQARLKCKDQSLNDTEYETLLDITLGLTDKAIARRRHVSVRGVQNRMSMVLSKLLGGEDGRWRESAGIEVYNPRSRLIFEAMCRGLIDPDAGEQLDKELTSWLRQEFGE